MRAFISKNFQKEASLFPSIHSRKIAQELSAYPARLLSFRRRSRLFHMCQAFLHLETWGYSLASTSVLFSRHCQKERVLHSREPNFGQKSYLRSRAQRPQWVGGISRSRIEMRENLEIQTPSRGRKARAIGGLGLDDGKWASKWKMQRLNFQQESIGQHHRDETLFYGLNL